LLAADGQPMVLDFHLAGEPIHPDGEVPPWLGGTAGYMSPEQHAAALAVQQGRKVARPVDGRSDVYSLGVLLYEALAGSLPLPGRNPGSTTTAKHGKVAPSPPSPLSHSGERGGKRVWLPPHPLWEGEAGGVKGLHHRNAQVSVGLADVV